MLLNFIKDLHYTITTFLQRLYTSSLSFEDFYSNWKLNSLSGILPNFPSSETIDQDNPILFIIKTIIFFLLKTQDFIVYFFSFKWLALADFAYLNVSVPENIWRSLPKIPPIYEYSNWIYLMFQKGTRFLERYEETIGYTILSKIIRDPYFFEDYNYIKYPPNLDKTNMVFSNSYQTISNLPKTLLEPSWFDSITVPIDIFGLPGIEYHVLDRTTNQYGFFRLTNFVVLSFFVLPIAINIFCSSFFNSFFINFPISISRIVSLRYFNVNNPYYRRDIYRPELELLENENLRINEFKNLQVSLLSVLGIVFGEICFIFLLILPPPFIQITLSYLDSIWPYIFGLFLVILVVKDGLKTNLVILWTDIELVNAFLKIKREPIWIFIVCFLLSLTEQSCCFAYFGSLNLNSTANFFDTYLFSAAESPIIFIFACLGFFIGSFFAITIYNFCLNQLLYFLFVSWKKKKRILSFIYQRYFSLRYTVINWWNSPNRNFKIATISDSLSFILQSYKTIQPISSFLNLFSVINSYLSKILTLFISKITQKNAAAVSLPGTTTIFDSNAFNLSVYPLMAQPIKNQQSFNNKIKEFSTIFTYVDRKMQWSILHGIDKFFVICLVIFSFTTIPFYSLDFMVNKFFGFIPRDQILNEYSLSNTTNDFGRNLGLKVIKINVDYHTQNESVHTLLFELGLFDQNNYGNSFWNATFESQNYRSLRLLGNYVQENKNKKKRKKFFAPLMKPVRDKLLPYKKLKLKYKPTIKGFTKNIKRIQQKKNIFLVDPKDFLNDNLREKNLKNFEAAFSVISRKVLNSDPDGFSRWSRLWGQRKVIKHPLHPYFSKITSMRGKKIDLRVKSRKRKAAGIRKTKLKKPFAYKYFHSPIVKLILSKDLKNFLKHQPLSQQLTDVQEKDLALLRVKMAHYYDSLRFYFNLKNQVHILKNSFEQRSYQVGNFGLKKKTLNDNYATGNLREINTHRQRAGLVYQNLQFPPMVGKSISSLNYRQQFKGSYKVIRELYDVSLYKNSKNAKNIFPEQTPKSESFEDRKKTTESKSNTNKQKNYASQESFSNFDLKEERSKNFTLPIQNFDKQVSNQSFKSSKNISFKDRLKNNIIITNDPLKIKLNKIKEATLVVADSLISRVKNRLYQIDPDLVTNSMKNFLPSNGWLPDRKALLSYDKSLFNEYDYNEENFLHEEAKIINSKDDLPVSHFSLPSIKNIYQKISGTNQILDTNKSFDQQNIRNFIKMNKKIKESTNPFYVGWDKKLRKFILTSRIIHRPYYLTQQTENSEALQRVKNKHFNNGLLSKIKKWLPTSEKHNWRQTSKPQMTQYYSSWPFMGEKLTSFKSNKYSGLYVNRRIISDNPKNKPDTSLQTYYFKNMPIASRTRAVLQVDDLSEIFNYYYYKNNKSIPQMFPRLYMPNNLYRHFKFAGNNKQKQLTPTSSTFLWSGTEDISSNYPISLLLKLEQKFLGYDTLYLDLDQKVKERHNYRLKYFKKDTPIEFDTGEDENIFVSLMNNLSSFSKIFIRYTFPKIWSKTLDYQNHITRHFEISEDVEDFFWPNYKAIMESNRALFKTEFLYPQEIKEDFYLVPNYKYPKKLQYTFGEIRTLQQGFNDEIEFLNDHQRPSEIIKSSDPELYPSFKEDNSDRNLNPNKDRNPNPDK